MAEMGGGGPAGMGWWRIAAIMALLSAWPLVDAAPASADLRVCNRTMYLLNVSLGSAADQDFKTEGWWSIAADTCQSVVRGTLQSRFFYLYAADIDGRTAVPGVVTMCVERRGFEIFGTAECWRRGYEAAGFVEVDTLDFDSWTVFLEEGGRVRQDR